MKPTVCLIANTIAYPQGGGHRWVYLNWALGLMANGCRVIWAEEVLAGWGTEEIRRLLKPLQDDLRPYGLADSVALYSHTDEPLPADSTVGCVGLDEVLAADLLVTIFYSARADFVRKFRRKTLVDIDPGILQIWVAEGQVKIADYDVYCTTGETVGRPGSGIPDLGKTWHYTPACVSLEHWPATPPPPGAAFTTVTQWWGGWIVYGKEYYSNEKRDGFLPYIDLPNQTTQAIELAVNLGTPGSDSPEDPIKAEEINLRAHHWRLREPADVAGSVAAYRDYVRGSKGEFACCKPSCVRLQNAWISDRTLCYLASGRPAIVQHTGPSRILPDAQGMFRFQTPAEAVAYLEEAGRNYDHHAKAARALVEEHFSAAKVTRKLLEVSLD